MRMLLSLMVILGLVACLPVAAQEPSLRVPVVEAVGKATAYATPTQVSFWLHRTIQKESLSESMEKALSLEDELRENLGKHELTPPLVEVLPPAITHMTENVVDVSAHLQFSMANYVAGRKGAERFAVLCGRVAALARELGCEAQGPLLEVDDRAKLVRAATIHATENAYAPASAVAEALKSNIYTVDTVQVLEVRWNEPLDSEATEPNIRQVSCTASVRVTYSLGTRN